MELTYQEILFLNDVVINNIQHKNLKLHNSTKNTNKLKFDLNKLYYLNDVLNNKDGQLFAFEQNIDILPFVIDIISDEMDFIINEMNVLKVQALADIETLTNLAELQKKILNIVQVKEA